MKNLDNFQGLSQSELTQIDGGKAFPPLGDIIDAVGTIVNVVNTLSDIYDHITNTDPQT